MQKETHIRVLLVALKCDRTLVMKVHKKKSRMRGGGGLGGEQSWSKDLVNVRVGKVKPEVKPGDGRLEA